VREKCTLKLSAGPDRGLQYTVKNTIHISNEVIASQAECPDALTMHEFYAFGTLRSGHRLQWRNIARELIARVGSSVQQAGQNWTQSWRENVLLGSVRLGF